MIEHKVALTLPELRVLARSQRPWDSPGEGGYERVAEQAWEQAREKIRAAIIEAEMSEGDVTP